MTAPYVLLKSLLDAELKRTQTDYNIFEMIGAAECESNHQRHLDCRAALKWLQEKEQC